MMRCGLLGQKLGHSYSPQIHARLGAYPYALFEKEPEELEIFLKSGDFTGINILRFNGVSCEYEKGTKVRLYSRLGINERREETLIVE